MEAEVAPPGCLPRPGETLGAGNRTRADRAKFCSLRAAAEATGGETERVVGKGSAAGRTPGERGHVQCTLKRDLFPRLVRGTAIEGVAYEESEKEETKETFAGEGFYLLRF